MMKLTAFYDRGMKTSGLGRASILGRGRFFFPIHSSKKAWFSSGTGRDGGFDLRRPSRCAMDRTAIGLLAIVACLAVACMYCALGSVGGRYAAASPARK